MMKEYPQIFYPTTDKVCKTLSDRRNQSKGFSESFFEEKLFKYFKGHIRKDVVIDDGRKKPYQPDYVFYYEEYGLFIDIEIDEPYANRSRKPIHVNDDDRNNYFLNNGWSIIRFSEDQIVKFPELCCKVISEHIRNLTGENIWVEGFHELNNLMVIKAWNTDEAKIMANNSHRSSYFKLLRRVAKKKPSINILADGIFLDKQIVEMKPILAAEIEIDHFRKSANISMLLKLLVQYASHFRREDFLTEKIHVDFSIFISKHHSFYSFSFDTDLYEIENFVINVYYIRTGGLVCFEIFEKIESEMLDSFVLIADDQAYVPFLRTYNEQNIVLARRYKDTFMPNNFR